MAWRLAGSLTRLRAEVNAKAPGRSRASDGTIGDPAHASRCSRHNKNDAGVVCALDLTHDPAGGYDAHAHADIRVGLARMGHGHPDYDYEISDGRVASRATGWLWREYKGSNKHRGHTHTGVGRGSDCEPGPTYDSAASWGIADVPSTPAPTPTPSPAPGPDNFKERVMALPVLRKGATGQYVRNMQGLLVANGEPVKVDGDFGAATDRGLRAWQGRAKLKPDGECGPKTWSALVGI